ncbi:hypothetical protein BS78_03G304400, partial [Paspalum vaginatum]
APRSAKRGVAAGRLARTRPASVSPPTASHAHAHRDRLSWPVARPAQQPSGGAARGGPHGEEKPPPRESLPPDAGPRAAPGPQLSAETTPGPRATSGRAHPEQGTRPRPGRGSGTSAPPPLTQRRRRAGRAQGIRSPVAQTRPAAAHTCRAGPRPHAHVILKVTSSTNAATAIPSVRTDRRRRCGKIQPPHRSRSRPVHTCLPPEAHDSAPSSIRRPPSAVSSTLPEHHRPFLNIISSPQIGR